MTGKFGFARFGEMHAIHHALCNDWVTRGRLQWLHVRVAVVMSCEIVAVRVCWLMVTRNRLQWLHKRVAVVMSCEIVAVSE